MNYRHIYHAGNFADLVKHCVLLALIESLKEKEKPFSLLDTHAGIGLYRLQSEEAQKKQEYQNGIAKLLFNETEKTPRLIKQYLTIVKEHNQENHLDFYPGSPLISLAAMRETDQLILSELQKEDAKKLKENLGFYENVAVHHLDAYHAMKGFLPPKTARGLVLIDPPFEKTTEYEDIIEHLTIALKHFRGGVYAIWYPIKDPLTVKKFYRRLRALDFPTHFIRFSLQNIISETALNAFGIAVINMPWKLPALLGEEILPYLGQAIECDWSLKGENIR